MAKSCMGCQNIKEYQSELNTVGELRITFDKKTIKGVWINPLLDKDGNFLSVIYNCPRCGRLL